MAPPTSRDDALPRLRETITQGRMILGAGAGIGLTAKFVERGGADIIVIYNSGRFRMAGAGSLAGLMPYGDANAIVVDMAKEVLLVVQNAALLAGVCATDPFRSMPRFLHELKNLGFCGVQNFPTVGLIDGTFRQNLEETGMSYVREVEMIREARQLGLLTTPYVFTVADAEAMTRAGADVIVVHMGLTTSGSIGARTSVTLDDCIQRIQECRDAAVKINEGIIVLCHGGPIATAEDAAYVLQRTKGVHGFFGASSMERLPVETAVEENAKKFKSISLGRKA
ncbi:TIM-barrel-protein domain-containing protein [Trametes polyzona]|nr:TIM-barrel-protein domain-containing protein [Trametes polyzona]